MAQAMSNPAWQNPMGLVPWGGRQQNPLLGGRAQPGTMVGGSPQAINLSALHWPPPGLGMAGSQGGGLTGNFTVPTSYRAATGQRRSAPPTGGIGPSGPGFPGGGVGQPSFQPASPSVAYNQFGQKLIGGQVVDAPTGAGRNAY